MTAVMSADGSVDFVAVRGAALANLAGASFVVGSNEFAVFAIAPVEAIVSDSETSADDRPSRVAAACLSEVHGIGPAHPHHVHVSQAADSVMPRRRDPSMGRPNRR